MIDTQFAACDEMRSSGLLPPVDTQTIDGFLAEGGFTVLFFAGPKSVQREAHDVAVALRELLKEYAGCVRAAVAESDDTGLQSRFRVSATPCLVFLNDGEILELMPRVRDWSEYADAFRRYLGNAPATEGMRAAG